MRKYVVRYDVEGFEGRKEAGPYESIDEAAKHFDDIAGYEGVKNVTLDHMEAPVEVPEVPAFVQCSECGFGQYTDRRTGSWYASIHAPLELRFQCCPEHARKAADKFAPIALDGWNCWEDPKHDLTPDHVVAATPEDLAESSGAAINKYVHEKPELSKRVFGPDGLGDTIAAAIAHHKANPLEWERVNDNTERAWDPVAGEHVYRPFLSDVRKAALRASTATLAEAMQSAGDGPRKALERFLEALKGEPNQKHPNYGVPGAAALEDRETYGFIRSSLRKALSNLHLDDDAIARVRATALNTVHGILGDEGHVQQLDIEVTEEGHLNLRMDLVMTPPCNTAEFAVKFHNDMKQEIKEIDGDALIDKSADGPWADGPGTAFGHLRDIMKQEMEMLGKSINDFGEQLAQVTQKLAFLDLQPEPVGRMIAYLPGVTSADVRVAPADDTTGAYDLLFCPTMEQPGEFSLDLYNVTPAVDGRYRFVFSGLTPGNHSERAQTLYATYRDCEWYPS